MKNATKHAAALKSLHRRLTKQHKAPERPQVEPLRAVVEAVLREDCDEKLADQAMAELDAEFVDVNELRVATELELAELMGSRYPQVIERSMRLRMILMSLFDAEGRLAIDRLADLNKREQRQSVRQLPQMSPFVEGYVGLLGFAQAAVPVDGRMGHYLVSQNVVEEGATTEEAQRFLEAHLKAEECWPFYFACRQEAFSRPAPRAPRARKAAAPKAAGAKPAASARGSASKRTTPPKRTTRQSA